MSDRPPFSEKLLSRTSEFRESYFASDPLSCLLVVDDFLHPETAATLSRSFEDASFKTFCIYTESAAPDAPVLKRTMEPVPDFFYISVQRRAAHKITALDEFVDRLASQPTMELLEDLTDIHVRGLIRQNFLSCFTKGHFLERHTDFGQGVKLSLSINFTKYWKESWGGQAIYSWKNTKGSVTVAPAWNRAVLFAPSRDSVHWVEEVKSDADVPRLSCTFHFF